MSGLIRHLPISQSHVFLVNSRPDRFSAPRSREDPFSRSYGVILPSSLAMIHSSTSGYSPRPPVSVYGTGRRPSSLRRVFSGVCLPALSARPKARGTFGHRHTPHRRGMYAYLPSTVHSVARRQCHFSVTVPLRAPGNGILTIRPSAFPSRAGLRSRLTLIRLALIRKPWACGVRVSRPHCRYLCLHLLFRTLHGASRPRFVAVRNAPLPPDHSGVRLRLRPLCPFIIHADPLD